LCPFVSGEFTDVAGELTRNKRAEKAKPTIFEIFASIQKLIDFLKTA
jgi:hypothetical protein